MTKLRKAAIYCRVSTDEQEEGTSLEQQELDCRRYAIQNGVIVVEHLVFKEAFTGTLYRERKLLSAIREAYRNGEINCVIIRTFDRLSRDQTHFTVLLEEMNFYQVELLCVKEQLDDSPMGKFARMMLGWVADFEREKIIDRTTTGKRNIAAIKHQIIPGSKPLYGYLWNDDRRKMKTHYILHPEESKVVLRIFQWYDQGYSLRAIVRLLEEEHIPPPRGEVWQVSTVRKMLHNRYYIGEAYAMRYAFSQKDRLRGKGMTLRPLEEQVRLPDDTVPAIIPVELFESVQKRLEVNMIDAARNNQDPHVTLLRSGFVKCGYCGSNMTVEKTTKGPYSYVAYYCRGRKKAIKTCQGPTALADKLDREVWAQVESLADDVQLIDEAIEIVISQDHFDAEVKSLNNSLATWIAQREQYQEDLKNPALRGNARTLILQDLSTVEETIERIQSEIDMVQQGKIDYEAVKREYKVIQTWCQTVQQVREALTYEQKRTFLRLLGIEVYVYRQDDAKHPNRYEVRVRLPSVAPLTMPQSSTGGAKSGIEGKTR